MIVVRTRLCAPTPRKAVVEALVEHHDECCPSGTCNSPHAANYCRDGRTHPATLPWEEQRKANVAMIRSVVDQLDVPRGTWAATFSTDRDDAVLASHYDSLILTPRLW